MTWGNLNFHAWSFGIFTRAKSWFLVLQKVEYSLAKKKHRFRLVHRTEATSGLTVPVNRNTLPIRSMGLVCLPFIFMVDIGKWKAEEMDAVQLTTTSVQASGPRLKQLILPSRVCERVVTVTFALAATAGNKLAYGALRIFCMAFSRWCYRFYGDTTRKMPSVFGCNLKTLVMTSAYLKDLSSVSNHQ